MLSPDFRFLWQFNGNVTKADYLTEGKGPYATLRTALPDLFWNSYDYRVRWSPRAIQVVLLAGLLVQHTARRLVWFLWSKEPVDTQKCYSFPIIPGVTFTLKCDDRFVSWSACNSSPFEQ